MLWPWLVLAAIWAFGGMWFGQATQNYWLENVCSIILFCIGIAFVCMASYYFLTYFHAWGFEPK